MRASLPPLRLPHLLAAVLCAGLAASNAVRVGHAALALAAFAALLALFAEPKRRLPLIALGLALAAWWWGSGRLDALDRSLLAQRAGQAARATVTVTGPPRRGSFALRVPARANRFGRLALDEPVLLELPLGRAPPQGATLELIAKVERPREPSDGFDERAWLRRQGVHVVLTADRWRVVGHRTGIGRIADVVRGRISTALAPGVSGERRAVLLGVVLGADEGLSEELRERFRSAGLYHLLAVSGQNVALVAGGALLLAWLLGLPRVVGQLLALAGMGGYVLAVGLQPSVVRAAVAGGLASLAWIAARERDRWHFLLLGAFALLAWNPYVLLDPGFQLSFAAVAAIFTLAPRLQRVLEGYPVPKPVAVVVAVSAACGLATAPISWVHFHAVPVLTVPANAIAAPAVVPLLGLALVAALVAPISLSAAAALAWLDGWFAAYLALCARLIGAVPFAQITSGRALLALAGVGLLAWALVRFPPRTRRRAAWAVAALSSIALLGWSWTRPAPLPPPTGLRVVFLDVGQGDATLLQVREGAVLVDEGPPEATVVRQLRGLGVARLAAIVATHPHRDHVGGGVEVLRRMPVGFVLDPLEPTDSVDELALRAEARRRDVRVVAARIGRTYALGRLRVRVLWPDGAGLMGDHPHDHAIVLLASYGEIDVLLTADAESDVTLPLRLPRAEILKVAHHGSSDPGLPELLRRVRPQIAVVSSGEGNDYGHPHPTTLAALATAPGLTLYRTDVDGRIVLETDGTRVGVGTDG